MSPPTDPSRMHRYDDQSDALARAVFDYVADRTRREVPLDRPRPAAELEAEAGAGVTPEGLGWREALRRFTEVLAPATISSDHPLHLAYVPGAPTESAVLFDLDKFKSVNDNFGHQTGDIVLQRFAEAALGALRPNDLIGRIGGEEFLALIPAVSEEAAVAIADRVRRAFAEAAEWVEGNPVKATVSAGVAIVFPSGRLETLHDLIDRADRALYAAKRDGRNRIATDGGPPDDDADNVIRLA